MLDCLQETLQRQKKIVSIFVERSHKLWNGDDVVKWLYEGCNEVVTSNKDSSIEVPKSAHIALMRYGKLKLEDFEDSFSNIPVANALDPRLVDVAMNVRPNARRMLRMPNQRGGEIGDGFDVGGVEGQRNLQQMRTLFGTGRDGMAVIDPDLPIAEVFWRSMLPWARVDGIPPGPPGNPPGRE